nr:hypothetical protein [uncultured Cohaesibacter sp.]
MTDHSTCHDCTYFDTDKAKEGDGGLCRFNPPIFLTEKDKFAHWPIVADNDWCGHFEDQKSA